MLISLLRGRGYPAAHYLPLPKVGGWENDTGVETGLRADTGKLSRGDAKKR
jgi:hypothetical protein